MKDMIREGMARAFFACAWADQADEAENRGINTPLGPGVDIMNVMPTEIDSSAYHAADTLISEMESSNNMSITDLFCSTGILLPEVFGHYAAMQAMGHGVGLRDFNIEITVPHVEFGGHSLDKDYF